MGFSFRPIVSRRFVWFGVRLIFKLGEETFDFFLSFRDAAAIEGSDFVERPGQARVALCAMCVHVAFMVGGFVTGLVMIHVNVAFDHSGLIVFTEGYLFDAVVVKARCQDIRLAVWAREGWDGCRFGACC